MPFKPSHLEHASGTGSKIPVTERLVFNLFAYHITLKKIIVSSDGVYYVVLGS